MIPQMPEKDRKVAMLLGLRADDIVRSWARYVTWTTEKFGEHVLLGGQHWERWAKQDAVEIATGASTRVRAEDKADRERRETAAYTREAVSFQTWASSLTRRRVEDLPQHERDVAEFARLYPRGNLFDFIGWHRLRGQARPVSALTAGEFASERREQVELLQAWEGT